MRNAALSIVGGMIDATEESLQALRREVSGVRYGPIVGDRGYWLFEWRGRTYRMPEPKDVVLVPDHPVLARYAVRAILDRSAELHDANGQRELNQGE